MRDISAAQPLVLFSTHIEGRTAPDNDECYKSAVAELIGAEAKFSHVLSHSHRTENNPRKTKPVLMVEAFKHKDLAIALATSSGQDYVLLIDAFRVATKTYLDGRPPEVLGSLAIVDAEKIKGTDVPYFSNEHGNHFVIS